MHAAGEAFSPPQTFRDFVSGQPGCTTNKWIGVEEVPPFVSRVKVEMLQSESSEYINYKEAK